MALCLLDYGTCWSSQPSCLESSFHGAFRVVLTRVGEVVLIPFLPAAVCPFRVISRFISESEGPMDTCGIPRVWWVVKAEVDLRLASVMGAAAAHVGGGNPGSLPRRGGVCLVLEEGRVLALEGGRGTCIWRKGDIPRVSLEGW